MVNLVIVSHSQQLAEGVKELAEEMNMAKVPAAPVHRHPLGEYTTVRDEYVQIAVANSGPQLEQCFSTSAASIADAIRSVWTVEGVLILVDMGSAVLNADLALELLPSFMSEKCIISNAPLVEGAIAATVEASLGRTLAQVNQAAESASHLRKI